MTLDPSAWRADDSVAFDAAREVVNVATAALFNLADTGALDVPSAVAEATKLRHALLSLDGFDREAVDRFIRQLDDRVAKLKGL